MTMITMSALTNKILGAVVDQPHFFSLQNEDGVSIQDRLMANMSKAQIREFLNY